MILDFLKRWIKSLFCLHTFYETAKLERRLWADKVMIRYFIKCNKCKKEKVVKTFKKIPK